MSDKEGQSSEKSTGLDASRSMTKKQRQKLAIEIGSNNPGEVFCLLFLSITFLTFIKVCEICRQGTRAEEILLCDHCDCGFHLKCLKPPLTIIPTTDWYCSSCLRRGDDFGFEEGGEYSLNSFMEKCEQFKKEYFGKLISHR
jgi:hypothetical protein